MLSYRACLQTRFALARTSELLLHVPRTGHYMYPPGTRVQDTDNEHQRGDQTYNDIGLAPRSEIVIQPLEQPKYKQTKMYCGGCTLL